MTSPLPPKRRDSRNLEDLLRQDRVRLGQLDRGLVGGRFSPARPLRPRTGDELEDDDPGSDIAFLNTDASTTTANGATVRIRLTYEPLDGSEQVFHNGVALARSEWSRTESLLTVPGQPYFRAGDYFWVDYAYEDLGIEAIEVGTYFDEVMARNPVGFWNFDGTYADASGHGYTLNHSGATFTSSLIPTEPAGQALDMNALSWNYTNTPVAAMDAIAGQFSVSWAGRYDDDSVAGYIVGQIAPSGSSHNHFIVRYDPTVEKVFVEWWDGTANHSHSLDAPGTIFTAHYFGVSVTATDVLLYVDGSPVSQVTKASAPIAQAAGQYLGVGCDGSTNNRWRGPLDGVALFATGLADDDQLRLALAAGYSS